jgi:hypothetical protein
MLPWYYPLHNVYLTPLPIGGIALILKSACFLWTTTTLGLPTGAGWQTVAGFQKLSENNA